MRSLPPTSFTVGEKECSSQPERVPRPAVDDVDAGDGDDDDGNVAVDVLFEHRRKFKFVKSVTFRRTATYGIRTLMTLNKRTPNEPVAKMPRKFRWRGPCTMGTIFRTCLCDSIKIIVAGGNG